MLTAHLVRDDGTRAVLESLEALLEGPDAAALERLGEVFGLDAESLEDCRRGEQRPRVDEQDDYVFIVVYGMMGAAQEGEYSPRKLAIYCGARFLITVHRERPLTIVQAHTRAARNKLKSLGRGVDQLLFTLIDKMVDKYLTVVQSYEDKLEEFEKLAATITESPGWLEDATDLRRQLLELRRIANSTREVVVELSGDCELITEEVRRRFAHVVDHLRQVVDNIDGLRELLNSVRDNYRALVANRTNEIMMMLTLVATVLLPISVIAGIYGMNVPLWPASDSPMSFWLVIGAMGAVAASMILYFRARRWI